MVLPLPSVPLQTVSWSCSIQHTRQKWLHWSEEKAATAAFVIRKCVKYCDIETCLQIDYVVSVSCVLSVPPPLLSLSVPSISFTHTYTLTHITLYHFPLIRCKRCERQIYALCHCGHNTEVMNGMLMNVSPHTSIGVYTSTYAESHSHTRSFRVSTNLAKTITIH